MKLRIAVLPGDGVGPEVTREAVRALRAVANVCGYDFEFREHAIGGAGYLEYGSPFPQSTRDACLQSDAVLLGAVGGPAFDGLPPASRPETGLLQLRTELGCFCNLRPVKIYDKLLSRSPLRPEILRGADLVIVRELLGGLYFGQPRGFSEDGSSAFNTMRYSRPEIERIAHIAFQLARARTRRVTSVDKANVLETSRLWRQVVNEVAHWYPDVHLEHAYVDSFAMMLVSEPKRHDVVLTENLFGDILSDEAAVLTGSLGVLASASVGSKIDLYEPIHGSAPAIAGKNVANPIGAIASAGLLLRYTAKLENEASQVENAINKLLGKQIGTRDIASEQDGWRVASTSEFGQQLESTLIDALEQSFAYHAV